MPAGRRTRAARPRRKTTIKLLGIDIGTTTAAAVVVDRDGKLLAEASVAHDADPSPRPDRAEQDVARLFDAATEAATRLPPALRRHVDAVGVTGQMHGVLLADQAGQAVSSLITWQDRRVLENGFLDQLNRRIGAALHAGFGCATLAYLAAAGELPPAVAAATTVADHFVARLVGEGREVTDPTNAASWGLFDVAGGAWDAPAVVAAGIPADLLPRVLPCGSEAGRARGTLADNLGLPADVPVAVAIGDNQASLLATMKDPERELALTLGTGGQLSAVLPPGMQPPKPGPADTWELRPYPPKRLAAVAAALCGGAAWVWLARTTQRWLEELGAAPPPVDDLFARLNELGLQGQPALDVRPTFRGERHDPSLRGRIDGIEMENFSLGNLARSLGQGMAANLKAMLPAEILTGRRRIVGSGNALRKNPLLRKCVQDVFGIPLDLTAGREEAAVGAAMNARPLVNDPGPEDSRKVGRT